MEIRGKNKKKKNRDKHPLSRKCVCQKGFSGIDIGRCETLVSRVGTQTIRENSTVHTAIHQGRGEKRAGLVAGLRWSREREPRK